MICAQLTKTYSAAPQATPTPAFTKNTKFNDLPDEVKKIFENIEYAEVIFCAYSQVLTKAAQISHSGPSAN
jgi:hypothetical protein